MKIINYRGLAALVGFVLAMFGLAGKALADDIGIFERILVSSGTFDETTAAFEDALAQSDLVLHAKHDMYVPDSAQKARLYVLTDPGYIAAQSAEKPNTISAQILRVAVYEYDAGKQVQINMANPVAHAMVFYSDSPNYGKLVDAARNLARKIRSIAGKVPGQQVSVQQEPTRSEDAYKGFNGDGPAKMMAKFRNWEDSQLDILEEKSGKFSDLASQVEDALKGSSDKGVDDAGGWRLLTKIQVRPDAIYYGITNLYTEDRTTSINSDFRSEGKADDAPFPGVDHVTAFPMEILVYNDGKKARAVHYGQMWRMQLYYWDSGYAAFAKYTLIPSIISGSIEETIAGEW